MAAVNQDLQVFAGEDNVIPFTIYVPGTSNTPQNITGWTIRFVVLPIGGGTIVVTKTSPASGVAITVPISGQGTITLLQADLTLLQYASVWHYRLERTDAGLDNWLTYGRLGIVSR